MFVSFLRVLLGVNWVDADYSNSQDSNVPYRAVVCWKNPYNFDSPTP